MVSSRRSRIGIGVTTVKQLSTSPPKNIRKSALAMKKKSDVVAQAVEEDLPVMLYRLRYPIDRPVQPVSRRTRHSSKLTSSIQDSKPQRVRICYKICNRPGPGAEEGERWLRRLKATGKAPMKCQLLTSPIHVSLLTHRAVKKKQKKIKAGDGLAREVPVVDRRREVPLKLKSHTNAMKAPDITTEKRRRGRPGKTVSVVNSVENTPEVAAEKRKRGRPRKRVLMAHSAEKVIEVAPKKRKSPMKRASELRSTETVPVVTTDKRKRGRPSKRVSVATDDTTAPQNSQPPEVESMETETGMERASELRSTETVPVVAAEKRKRGRPSKRVSVATDDTTAPQNSQPPEVEAIETVTASEFLSTETVPVVATEKRKRGRPCKIVSVATDDTTAPQNSQPPEVEAIVTVTADTSSEPLPLTVDLPITPNSQGSEDSADNLVDTPTPQVSLVPELDVDTTAESQLPDFVLERSQGTPYPVLLNETSFPLEPGTQGPSQLLSSAALITASPADNTFSFSVAREESPDPCQLPTSEKIEVSSEHQQLELPPNNFKRPEDEGESGLGTEEVVLDDSLVTSLPESPNPSASLGISPVQSHRTPPTKSEFQRRLAKQRIAMRARGLRRVEDSLNADPPLFKHEIAPMKRMKTALDTADWVQNGMPGPSEAELERIPTFGHIYNQVVHKTDSQVYRAGKKRAASEIVENVLRLRKSRPRSPTPKDEVAGPSSVLCKEYETKLPRIRWANPLTETKLFSAVDEEPCEKSTEPNTDSTSAEDKGPNSSQIS